MSKKGILYLMLIASVIVFGISTSTVSALPLSDQEHGNWLQRASIIINPPTYTLSGIYYNKAVGNCAANMECTSFYANEPGKIYVWVDGTGWGGTMIGHPGFQTLVKITSQDVSVEWGDGTAVFLPPVGSYIKVPVIVTIPSSQTGQTSARVYQSILLNGVVQPNGFAMWQNYWLPSGVTIQANPIPTPSLTPTPIPTPSLTPTPIPTPSLTPTPIPTPSLTPTPIVTEVTPARTVAPYDTPGFEAMFAIAGLVAVVYLVLRQVKKKEYSYDSKESKYKESK